MKKKYLLIIVLSTFLFLNIIFIGNVKAATHCIYRNEASCEKDPGYSCIWVEDGGYCNVDELQYVSCGDAYDIPAEIPTLTSFLVNLLKIGTPIILIFVSVISLLKSIASSKEDEIKKAQNSLVRKIMIAVIIFFVISIVQFVINMVAADNDESKSISSCLKCFLNGSCEGNKYAKANVNGVYKCRMNGSWKDCSHQ